MKNQYLCYKCDAQTAPCALTIERLANVLIHADHGATFKFQVNPSYSQLTNPVSLFLCVYFNGTIFIAHDILLHALIASASSKGSDQPPKEQSH